MTNLKVFAIASSYTIFDNAATDARPECIGPHNKIYVQITLYVQLASYSHIGVHISLRVHLSKPVFSTTQTHTHTHNYSVMEYKIQNTVSAGFTFSSQQTHMLGWAASVHCLSEQFHSTNYSH